MSKKSSVKASKALETTEGPVVYLLHADKRLGGPRHTAAHYCGYSERLAGRIWHHRNGTSGVPIVAAFVAIGAKLDLVRVWTGGSRTLERSIKNSHNLARYCPVCNPTVKG